ncbi:ARM repeat-containing protein [Saccharata proteae CBS 121410]|uniref:ARM repeat-containing protein n=1 Tax=Saccharata proteae CBS 121410 TaxID=1314787 RepID=A0A6A5YEE7_9PEZI|nr:ARM repeat-containing protein [Saccharata proteae CBS 121410]
MEANLVRLLAETQSPQEGPRKEAERQLLQLYPQEAFPLGLVAVASHESVPLEIRQSALLVLKTYVTSVWSAQFEECQGQVLANEELKSRLRTSLLELATGGTNERKIKTAASYVVSKIASADFPEQWPELLPTLLHIIPTGTDSQLHGTLKVLQELVDDGLSDEQFFQVAPDLVKVIYDVAVSDQRKPTLRALAVAVFRGCFDILEMIMEDHKDEVKRFASETLAVWLPFFIEVLKSKLPPAPAALDQTATAETYRGIVALKLQVVKVLMRVRSVFPSNLSPQSPVLFSATWEELSSLQGAYHQMYIEDERQSRLEDADGLPYTLDFLVLEELDFMQACLKAPPVRKHLEQELQGQTGDATWVTEVMKLAVAYAQITTEEEALWNIDVNIFLSEETSVTANYTPRTACGDLVIKLGEWLTAPTVEGLLSYTRSLYSTNQTWKAKEAALYILNQLLSDFQDRDGQVSPEAATGFIDFIRYAMQQPDEFLRARGFLVAGGLTRTSADALQQVAPSFMEASLHAITNDDSDVVKVSCIRALQYYLGAVPPAATLPMQGSIIAAVSSYMATQDLEELAESDDLMVTLVETLRDAILLDTQVCINGGGLDLLFTIASHGASNFQLTMLVTETFEEITSSVAATGPDAFTRLCEKVLPSLTGAFDVGTLTEENALTNLAAELLAVLTEHSSTPLPQGFVVAVMPKVSRLLMGSNDEELLKAATTAVKNILEHDHQQLFDWHDEVGKGGLEVVLVIIDRLLSPSVDDNAAAEVGALAAEVVEKAGSERLGPYLMQLLRAVAVRLGSATQAQFIQSLTLVFARLSLVNASEVVDFLAQVQVGQENGLQVVMSKWLENSIMFAGYEEIRQNVIALSKLYDLNDPRLTQVMVKGDLVMPQTDRIMTRSRARQNPDRYTMIPAPLKILKVLVEELLSASGSGNMRAMENAAAAAELADDDDEDEEWEDDPTELDLGLGSTKAELMAYGDESSVFGGRQRDDETQAYLIQFFRESVQKPGFQEAFNAMTPQEQEKLRTMN